MSFVEWMCEIWATFNHIPSSTISSFLRQNTRIYYHSQNSHPSPGQCLGTVWMCNPGTPRHPNPIGFDTPVIINPDTSLRKINAVFDFAVTLKCGGTLPPISSRTLSVQYFNHWKYRENPYLQIINLFYATGSNAPSAWSVWKSSGLKYHELVDPTSQFVWVAWGKVHPIKTAHKSALRYLKRLRKPLVGLWGSGSGKGRTYSLWSHIPSFPWLPCHPMPLTMQGVTVAARGILPYI